jgi:hypothetical protein
MFYSVFLIPVSVSKFCFNTASIKVRCNLPFSVSTHCRLFIPSECQQWSLSLSVSCSEFTRTKKCLDFCTTTPIWKALRCLQWLPTLRCFWGGRSAGAYATAVFTARHFYTNTNAVAFNPQGNYTDWDTVTFRRCYCEIFRIGSVIWLAQWVATTFNLVFLDRNR